MIKKNNNKNRDSISKVIADGSYDSNENFQFLSSNGIEPAIKEFIYTLKGMLFKEDSGS